MSMLDPFANRSTKRPWIIFIAILAVTLIAGLFVHPHGMGGIEESFGFPAWYAFLACVVLVGISRLIGFVLKRPDTYFDE